MIRLANGRYPQSFSFCVGNFYFWQALTTIGFYHYLRRLAAKFPPPPTIASDLGAVDVGPDLQQLVEQKEAALREAASENAGLRAKVDHLEKDVDFISNDRYALVRDKCILQNKLEDFNSWPEFRVEYDQLATEFEAMKRQRAREHISQDQVLQIAKEAKLELAEAKLAKAMSKIAHSEELKQAQQERDEAKERYQTLLAKITADAVTIASSTAVVAPAVSTPAIATSAATEVTPGDKVLQEENTRLTLALRFQTSLLAKKSSDLERMQTLLQTRSNHSSSELRTAAATILDLEEEKEQADSRIAELERNVKEANEKAEEMEGLYMAVAFGDDSEGEKEEEGENGEEGAQMVTMSKKKENEKGTDEDASEEDDDDEEGDKNP